jgi:hypothetical protein
MARETWKSLLPKEQDVYGHTFHPWKALPYPNSRACSPKELVSKRDDASISHLLFVVFVIAEPEEGAEDVF